MQYMSAHSFYAINNLVLAQHLFTVTQRLTVDVGWRLELYHMDEF